jgi:hypothetical protein
VDDDSKSVAGLCHVLGTSPAEFMIVFLPVDLENRMLELELAYGGAKEEEDVVQTHFQVVPRDGGFDVQVSSQVVR